MRGDREMLTAAMDGFLERLTDRQADNPYKRARYTENGVELSIGEGAWATADATGPYRHDIVDPDSCQIASFVTLREGATRSIMNVRLRITGDAITDIEMLVARPDFAAAGLMADGAEKLDASPTPDPRWFAPVPTAEQMSRAELRRVANCYFTGLQRNDGRGHYPFAEDCVRVENGYLATAPLDQREAEKLKQRAAEADGNSRAGQSPYTWNFLTMSAREQFETGFFAFVDRIRHRRFPIVDRETGCVFTHAFFDHSGTVRDYQLANGETVSGGLDRPFTWMIAEAFRIENGLFTRIEALMAPVPYGMGPNWPLTEHDIR
ncbi:hypothetical protein [Altericroceibacterium endophyticum]|uniref:DUF8021 domain-containing protein n=1 Tax=Altericroceibacterium endophyticum TaxID=1808508 RepID=A0A6I4T1Z9_9SPHN|nr:hypothetical protein [Altericroceibacterium endophyticum]MXO65254.1 hypothetical protein [Altericroceibacterium endophyticum]